MHGHIQYVHKQLSRIGENPIDEEKAVALRCMRIMLINGLQNSRHHSEYRKRLFLVSEIDKHLNERL